MSAELLGIVDSLEATILEASKIPFSDNIIIDEKSLLSLIDKIRIAMKSQGNIVRNEIEIDAYSNPPASPLAPSRSDLVSNRSLQDKQMEYDLIKSEARAYADDVLAGLHSMVSKMQYSLTRLDASLQQSRESIDDLDEEK